MGFAQDKAEGILQAKIEDAISRETEALEGLAEAETQISSLTAHVAEIQQQAADKNQAAETAAAVAVERIESMTERIQSLETERKQLIEAAESSRTETAKALMQVERADRATEKAEKRLEALENQVSSCLAVKVEAEKIAAVAEQHAADLTDQLADTKAALAEIRFEK